VGVIAHNLQEAREKVFLPPSATSREQDYLLPLPTASIICVLAKPAAHACSEEVPSVKLNESIRPSEPSERWRG